MHIAWVEYYLCFLRFYCLEQLTLLEKVTDSLFWLLCLFYVIVSDDTDPFSHSCREKKSWVRQRAVVLNFSLTVGVLNESTGVMHI